MNLYIPSPYQKAPISRMIEEGETGAYRFLVVGDRCGIPVPHRFEQAMELISQQSGQFVIGVGDYVDGYWLQEADAHKDWEHTEALLQQCQKPFLQTVGNHDYGNAIMQKVWHDRLGADYYAMEYHNDLFCFLNSEDPSAQMPDWIGEKVRELSGLLVEKEDQIDQILGMIQQQMEQAEPKDFGGIDVSNTLQPSISKEQLSFFETILQQHKDCRHIFLIIHEPAWKCENEQFQQLLALCEEKDYTVLSGHLHNFEHTKIKGHDFYQMQQTGGLPHGHMQDGILVVDVNEKVQVSMLGLDGKTIEI